MTKVLHVVESFAGGVFDFIVELTNGMPEIEHIIIYSEREHTAKDYASAFPVSTRFIKWRNATREINPKKDIAALFFLLKELKTYSNVAVIHLHSSKAGFLGRAATRIFGLHDKVIYTPHGASFLRQDVTIFKKKVFVFLEKLGSHFGGQVIACSKSEAEAFNDLGIIANYVNNGIDCGKRSPGNIQISKSHKTRIGTIGRITYQKNPTLFRQIAQVIQSKYNTEFIWIGDGEMRDELGDKINVTGWVTKEKILDYLGKMDIYLSTSLWEGLPLSVLQAMYCEKPLILSNCIGNRDLIIEGYNGILFNNLDEATAGLSNMICTPNNIRVMGNNSLALATKKFSINQMLQGYRKIYSNITD